MKKFLFVCSVLLSFLAVGLFAQEAVPVTPEEIGGQVADVLNSFLGKDLAFKILLGSAIAGTIVHIVYSTYKGVTESDTSPFKFVLWYWIKDNVLAKLVTVLTFVSSTEILTTLFAKLPAGWIFYVITGLIGFLIGYFLDYFTSFLKKNIPAKS